MRAMALLACVGIFSGGRAIAQAGGAKPAFQVASVKRSTGQGTAGTMRGGPGTDDPGRIAYLNVPLRMAISQAFGLESRAELDGPDWMNAQRYDIVANVPPGTTQEECSRMLQALLVQRFQMMLRHETRDTAGYRLTVGKTGSKLREAGPGAVPTPVPNGFPQPDAYGIGVAGGDGTYRLTARHRSTSFLLQLLAVQLQAQIDDQTGLNGVYDYNLGFVPARFLESSEVHRFPDLRTAVEDQLGLKLVETKVPMDVLVVQKANPEPLQN